jgi:hypothetical protein
MKPQTEYIARQLAGLVLSDDGPSGRADGAAIGAGVVEVNLRGMTHSIRRQLLVDHVSLAEKIANEIERQTTGLDLDALVARTVTEEVNRLKACVPNMVRSAVEQATRDAVHRASVAATVAVVDRLTRGVADRLYAVANAPNEVPPIPKRTRR